MKKILTTLALVLALALCMSVSAFAAETTLDEAGDVEIEVNGVYKAGDPAAEVISVDIAWGSMSFTYTDAFEGKWDAENHEYTESSEAAWTCDDGANTITVTNHSNTDVEAQLAFEAAVTGITGSFDVDTMELTSAVGVDVEDADFAVATFTVAGAITESATLGTITVTVVSK